MRIIHLPLILLLCLFAVPGHAQTDYELIPNELAEFMDAGHSLPRYEEAYYSPLGRNAMVDAALGDPFWLPTYGRSVSDTFNNTTQIYLYELFQSALIAGGFPVQDQAEFNALFGNSMDKGSELSEISERLRNEIGRQTVININAILSMFLMVNASVDETLSVLSDDEKQFVLENPDLFFFGHESTSDYDFFTTESNHPMEIFRIAAKVDIAKLAHLNFFLTTGYESILNCTELLDFENSIEFEHELFFII